MKPITTWHEAADVLGISYDTLWRRRKKYGCTLEEPHWRDADHVWGWYTALKASKAAEKRKPGRPTTAKAPTLAGPFDAAAKRRALLKRD